MVVLRSISLVNTPPMVSIPRDRGVTSSSSTSFTSPARMPPWMAAPMATTSSGFTERLGSLPKNSPTFFCTRGIRVMPPTRMTSSIWLGERPASARAFWQGAMVRSTRSLTRASSLARESLTTRCLGPVWSAVMKGRFTSASMEVDRSFLVFSAASFRRCRAMLSLDRSMPFSFLNSSTR